MTAHRRRALLMDANTERCDAARQVLVDHRFVVTCFADAASAAAAHLAEPFGLAVVGVEQAQDALGLCRALRRAPGACSVLVLVPSPTTDDLSSLLESGATDVRAAPFSVDALGLRLMVLERKAAIHKLAESLLHALPDLVFCVTKGGELTDFHAPDVHELYAPQEEIIGAYVADLLPPAVAAGTMAAVERALSSQTLQVFEYMLTLPAGDADFEARVVPNGDDEVVCLVRNVTAQRKALEATRNLAAAEERARVQEKLLHMQRTESLGLLAGGIAHDFNNLLTAIMGNASVALLKLAENSAARPAIDALVVATRRAADLTQQLLAYSGKGRFQIRLIDLSEHIREIVALLEAAAPKHVHVRLQLAEDLPAIECDVAQIQQVVMNLVINATEAIGAGRGTVLVTTGRQTIDETYPADGLTGEAPQPGEYVFVEVHDDGKGMDESTLSKVFDPFYTTKATGRGLGLAAVLGIVRAHKGVIRIYSKVSQGTTFKVLFPAQEQPVDLAPPPRKTPVQGAGLVLVVDDEDLLRQAARAILEHFGFTVLEACTGEEGLEQYERFRASIGAVLLDMTMPGISGEETFRRLRQLRPDVQVLLSSGYNEIEATRRFTSKGLAGFLQKPYTASQLGEAITRIFDKRSP